MYAKRCCVQNWPVDRPWKEILGNAHTTENFLCVEGCRSLFSLAWFERWSLRLTSVFAAYFSSLAHFLEHYLTTCSTVSKFSLRSILTWLRTPLQDLWPRTLGLEKLSHLNVSFGSSRLTSNFAEETRQKKRTDFSLSERFVKIKKIESNANF